MCIMKTNRVILIKGTGWKNESMEGSYREKKITVEVDMKLRIIYTKAVFQLELKN